MKLTFTFFLCTIFLISFTCAQDEKTPEEKLPYHQIPDAPENYTAENVAARMIDGLGYRYYWATEELTEENLTYQPSEDSRTIAETLEHLYGLSRTILNGAKNAPNIRHNTKEDLTFAEKRKRTLENFKTASDLLKMENSDLNEKKIIFQRGEKKSEFPFWNMINGPIADALWHAGQIVGYRRAAGNPIPAGVNVFIGKTRGQ